MLPLKQEEDRGGSLGRENYVSRGSRAKVEWYMEGSAQILDSDKPGFKSQLLAP